MLVTSGRLSLLAGMERAGVMRNMRRAQGPMGFLMNNMIGPWSKRQILHAITYLISAPER